MHSRRSKLVTALRFLAATACLGWAAFLVMGMLFLFQEEPVTWITWLVGAFMLAMAVLASLSAEYALPEEWKLFKAVDELVYGLVDDVALAWLQGFRHIPGIGGRTAPEWDTWTEEDDARFREWKYQQAQPDVDVARLRTAAYILLDVREGAGPDEINRAWRREAGKFHPDRVPEGQERMKAINMARDLLLGK